MVKVTILGSGVTGMTIASKLPRDYEVTIVGEYHPGDHTTTEWASPWAAAIWVGVHKSSPREQQMQLEGFAGLWKLAETNPESSVRQIEMTEIMDTGSKEDVWYAGKVPNFRFMSKEELPEGAIYGMKYMTLVITPTKFLPWMYERLQGKGVKFLRTRVTSLKDLRGLGHDILINASGMGSEKLLDVKEETLTPWRMQVVVAKTDSYNRLYIHRGANGYYSTAFSRMDGTVWVGGILEEGVRDTTPSEAKRALICRRAHEEQPDVFPSPNHEQWPILRDHVGIFAAINKNVAGVRCEREMVGDQKVIHAYGQHAGGYVYSFGLARAVANMVEEYVFEMPASAKL